MEVEIKIKNKRKISTSKHEMTKKWETIIYK
jgi:hypothetical protein